MDNYIRRCVQKNLRFTNNEFFYTIIFLSYYSHLYTVNCVILKTDILNLRIIQNYLEAYAKHWFIVPDM